MSAQPATATKQSGGNAGKAPRAPWSGLHSSRIRYRFKVPVMDFFLQWALGSQTHGSTEIGESFYAASQMKDGDPRSWVRAWEDLAERVEARGRASLAAGHPVSARESLLRAYSYHRAPQAFISPLKEAEQVKARYARAEACFRDACPLFDPPFDEVSIPFEGKSLPGYFLKAGVDDTPRKTLLMIGGGETFVEDLYGCIGPAALKRGYNMLMVDLPQQGLLPFDGLVARADYGTPVGVVIDHLLMRPDSDPDRTAALGISGGGYVVPRATMHEKRIRALVAMSMMLDVHEAWSTSMGADNLAAAERRGLLKVLEKMPVKRVRTGITLFDLYQSKYGVNTLTELLEIAKTCTVDPSRIDCPTLILVAQQEYEEFSVSRRWQEESLAKIRNVNKRIVVHPRNEGADSHAGGTNLSLVAQLAFDWLDDLFDPSRPAEVQPLSAATSPRGTRGDHTEHRGVPAAMQAAGTSRRTPGTAARGRRPGGRHACTARRAVREPRTSLPGDGFRGELGAGAVFVALGFVLSWLPLRIVLTTTGSINGSPAPRVLWALSGFGPLLAAGLASRLHYGRGGPRRVLAQLTAWRQGWWYLVLLLPLAPALVALTVVSAVSGTRLTVSELDVLRLLAGFLLAGILLGGLEEIDWRGYLLPLLQGRAPAFLASAVVGLVWAAWHAPLFFVEGTSQSRSPWAWFTLQAVALAVVLSSVYNSTASGLLVVVLTHGAVNAWYAGAVHVLGRERLNDFMGCGRHDRPGRTHRVAVRGPRPRIRTAGPRGAGSLSRGSCRGRDPAQRVASRRRTAPKGVRARRTRATGRPPIRPSSAQTSRPWSATSDTGTTVHSNHPGDRMGKVAP